MAVTPSPKRRTVLSRVLLSYVVITLSFALVAGYAVLQQRESVRDTELMRSGYLPLALSLRDAVALQNTYNSQLNHITEARNPRDKRVWFETSLRLGRPRAFMEIRAALNRAFSTHQPDLGRSLSSEATDIGRFLEADREILQKLFAALDQGDESNAQRLRDELVTRGNEALTMLRTLEERVNLQVDSLIRDASARERWTLRILLGWALFTVAFGVGVGLYARRLLRPLEIVTARAKAVSQGDLTPQQAVGSNDEIGELARTFESMVSAIARANRELLESERLATIGKMAAHVTHEVRNPLSSIALNLELLEEELASADGLDVESSEQARREAQMLHLAIKQEVERLTELTEQYLSLARRNEPNLEEEDLVELVQEALAFLTPDLTRHRVAIECQFDEHVPPVWVDEAQVKQVVHNLVRNARQAMPKGGELKVSVRVRDDTEAAKQRVELQIADTGVGIDKEVRRHLFEPFFTTKNHGTGLGLAISRHIIETHRGRIVCEANEPRGTRFVITLPTDAPPTAPRQAEE